MKMNILDLDSFFIKNRDSGLSTEEHIVLDLIEKLGYRLIEFTTLRNNGKRYTLSRPNDEGKIKHEEWFDSLRDCYIWLKIKEKEIGDNLLNKLNNE